jgi:GxxExxY protein
VWPNYWSRNESSLDSQVGISRIGLSKRSDLGIAEGGLRSEAQKPISVKYNGQIVGAFAADLLVNDSVIVEVKAIQTLAKPHEIQLVNYLTATRLNEGLPLNFGADRLEFKKKFRLAKTDSAASKSTVIL